MLEVSALIFSEDFYSRDIILFKKALFVDSFRERRGRI